MKSQTDRCTNDFFGAKMLALTIFGAILTTKMTSDDNSPKEKNDCQVKIYSPIHFIGPLDLVLKASRVSYYNGGM